jgi:hypothetical protein
MSTSRGGANYAASATSCGDAAGAQFMRRAQQLAAPKRRAARDGGSIPAWPQWEQSSKGGRPAARSCPAVRASPTYHGYHIKASDGEIGHLEDFLFDDDTWEIRYAIVDTKNWWPGKKVLLRPQWIKRVSWAEQEIYTELSREAIRKSPEWNAEEPLSRDYELHLHRHYGYAPLGRVRRIASQNKGVEPPYQLGPSSGRSSRSSPSR